MRWCATVIALCLAACDARGPTESFAGLSVSLGPVSSPEVTGVPTGPCTFSLDFGAVPVGTTRTVSVELTNSDRSSWELLSVVPLSDPQFSLALDVPATLASGENLTVPLTFSPVGAGRAKATTTLLTNEAVCPAFTLTLTGEGSDAPCLQAAPSVVDFGQVLVGTSALGSLAVTNCGVTPVTLADFTISGSDVSLFQVLSAPLVPLGPGQSKAVSLRYRPLVPGVENVASLTLLQSDRPPLEVLLLGNPVASPVLVASALDFGEVAPGSTKTLPLSVKNVTGLPVTVQSAELLSAVPGAFSSAPGVHFPLALEAGAQAVLPVTFAPARFQSYGGTLQFQFAEGLPATVSLSGTGGTVQLRCAPAALDFDLRAVGSTSTRSLTCTNSGSAPVPLAIGGVASPFGIEGPPQVGGSLPVGQSLTWRVSYQPVAAESDQAQLMLSSELSVPAIPLRGRAIAVDPCEFVISPIALDFGRLRGGQSAELATRMTNTGTSLCLLADLGIANNLGDAYQLLNAPTATVQLGSGASFDFTVNFAPVIPGTYGAELTFQVSNPLAPQQSLPLIGSLEAP